MRAVITAFKPDRPFDRRLLITAFTLIFAFSVPLVLHGRLQVDLPAVAGLGYVGLLLLGLIGGATFFMPVPSLPFVFLGAGLIDPIAVAMVAALGMTLGMGLTYFFGVGGRHIINWRIASRPDRLGALVRFISGKMARSGVRTSFLLAAVPNPVYDFAGLIAGSSRIPFGRFILGVFLGKAAQTLCVAALGAYAVRIPGLF